MEKNHKILTQSPLFAGVSGEEVEELLHCLQARTARYPKGSYLLRAGDTTDSLGVVLEGRALVIHEDFWGSRNLMASLAPGQCFAETFACTPQIPMTVSVVADTNLEVLFLNVRRVLEICPEICAHHSRMVRNLLTEMARKNVAFSEKLTHLGQRTTRAKLISYLSAEAQRRGSAEFDIPFSRQQLADYLFVERSGLSQELCRLRDEGLIDFHKNHFRLCQFPDRAEDTVWRTT